MSKLQKLVLSIYCLVIFAMILYPPYVLIVQGHLVRSEYSWIWAPIMYGTEYGTTPLGVIDVSKILIQMLGASLISIALIFMFRSEKLQ